MTTMPSFPKAELTLVALLPALGAGCGGDDVTDLTGTVDVAIYGESFIEDGIPAAEMSDGWAVTFDRFDATLSGVTLGGIVAGTSTVVDLSRSSQGSGHAVAAVELPEGEYNLAAYVLGPVVVEGSATRAESTVRFAWTFPATRYSECEIALTPPGRFEVTVHADHLFYDSLVSEDPALGFDALANADADADGILTQAELAQADIGSYDPGSSGNISDLWTYLVALSRTLGHVNGEGHCPTATAL